MSPLEVEFQKNNLDFTFSGPRVASLHDAAQSIRAGLVKNLSREVRSLSSKRNWVERKIRTDESHGYLPQIAWKTLGGILALDKVIKPKQVVALIKHPVFSKQGEQISLSSFKSLRNIVAAFDRYAPQISFEQIKSLLDFLQSYSVGNELPNPFLRSFESALSHSENPAEICNEILSIAANSERVLDADRAISKSKKGNQYKIRNRLSKNQRTCSFATILKYTGLPENVQKELVVAWPNIKEQLNPTARSLGSIVSLAYHFVVINHCLEKSALTEGFDAEKAKRSFLPRVIEAIGDVGSIATLMTQLVGNEVKGMGRMQFLLGALEQDTKHAGLKAIVKVAQAYDIELEKVPQAFVSTSHTIVAQCLKNSVSNKERSLEELTDLVQAISDLVAHDYDLSNPEKINRFCKVYDLFESPKLASQLKYLLWQCSRINKGKEFTYSSKDIDRFTRARSSYVELRSHDCSSETAARLAWDYSIVLAPGPAMQEVFDSVLTQTASFESLSARTIDWSKNGAIEDRDFANALGFIASVLGPEWKEIKKKSHEIVTYSRPFSKPSALGIQNLRKVISRLSELTADNMAKVYSRYKKEMFVSDVRDSLVTYVQSTDKTELKAAAHELDRLYQIDSGPYPISLPQPGNPINPEYKRMITEVKAIYRNVFDLHYGFSHLTYECMRSPDSSNWLMVRFGLDSAVRVSKLNHDDPNTFPGAGCLIAGLKTDRILPSDPSNPQDRFAQVKQIWTWAANEIDDLENTSYLFARGCMAVLGPDTPKYYLDGVHYSLIIWNDHFHNSLLEAAALVPTVLLRSALEDKFNPVRSDGSISRRAHAYTTDEDLSAESLKFQCINSGFNYLDLGWASNLGSLANAYPPESSPYFEWEAQIRNGHSKDRAGHTHKSHITDTYLSTMTFEMETKLKPLREAHSKVFAISSAYLNSFDLYRISLSLWHKGFTIGEEMGEDVNMQQSTEENPRELGPYETRMLEEAYRWHSLRNTSGTQKNAFPILCLAPVLNYWSKVNSPVYLDTYDLSLRAPDFQGRLPSHSNGTGGLEVGLWQRHVRPHYYQRSDLDLRFLNRTLLGLE